MKRILSISTIACIIAAIVFSLSSCKKDKLLTDASAKLNFSSDSVLFDTVFTTVGSATRNIRVINKNGQKVKISSINLLSGNSSPFILNVDGAKGKSFSDIEIPAMDSIYIFIQVNVNPTNSNSPLIISDKILFSINGNEQQVNLEAWGQDAYYHHPTNALKFVNGGYLAYSTISPATTATTVTWAKDKPHVIYGWLVVDSAQTLIIDPGVKVYFHQNAGLWVYYCGTLKAKGALNNEITFQGDRFESELADTPGQWDRIWINEGSTGNELDYCIIKNGYIGVQAELLYGNFFAPKRVKITNTQIHNMSKWGIYAKAFNIFGANNVVSNCKEYCAALTWGGKYTFIHNTFANYWTSDSRTLPTLHVDNHTDTQILPLDSCYFGNSIIDGDRADEIELDLNTTGASTLQPVYVFSYSVLKSNFTNDGAKYIGCRAMTNPDYANKPAYDFHPGPTNSALNLPSGMGNVSADAGKYPLDLRGYNRLTDGLPDAGAMER